MILLGSFDECRINIDADYVVACRGEVPTYAAGTAAGIEYPGAACHHRVDQAGFAVQVLPSARHGSKTFDVPLRMAGVSRDLLHPDALLDHATIVAADHREDRPGLERCGLLTAMAGRVGAVWADVHTERAALVDDLSRLRPAQWRATSLCDGWAVRDVVAHLAATAVLTKRRFAREIIRAGFSVDRIVQRQVAAGRRHGTAELLAALRTSVSSTASPPLPVISRLVEIIVHGEDIRRPLGLQHSYCLDHVGATVAYVAADRLSGGKRRLAGLRLIGTDIDVVVGDGLAVTGPAVSLLLAACGRRVALSELSGPGAGELGRRI